MGRCWSSQGRGSRPKGAHLSHIGADRAAGGRSGRIDLEPQPGPHRGQEEELLVAGEGADEERHRRLERREDPLGEGDLEPDGPRHADQRVVVEEDEPLACAAWSRGRQPCPERLGPWLFDMRAPRPSPYLKELSHARHPHPTTRRAAALFLFCAALPTILCTPAAAQPAPCEALDRATLATLSGTWTSMQSESWYGACGTREFRFDDGRWSLRFTLALDPAMQAKVFEFRTGGPYYIAQASKTVPGVFEAVFMEEGKHLTLRTRDPKLVQALGLASCGLEADVEKDISVQGMLRLEAGRAVPRGPRSACARRRWLPGLGLQGDASVFMPAIRPCRLRHGTLGCARRRVDGARQPAHRLSGQVQHAGGSSRCARTRRRAGTQPRLPGRLVGGAAQRQAFALSCAATTTAAGQESNPRLRAAGKPWSVPTACGNARTAQQLRCRLFVGFLRHEKD